MKNYKKWLAEINLQALMGKERKLERKKERKKKESKKERKKERKTEAKP